MLCVNENDSEERSVYWSLAEKLAVLLRDVIWLVTGLNTKIVVVGSEKTFRRALNAEASVLDMKRSESPVVQRGLRVLDRLSDPACDCSLKSFPVRLNPYEYRRARSECSPFVFNVRDGNAP